MPKDSKLDRCHEHVKEALEKKDIPNADGKAWGVCKKKVKNNDDKSSKK